MRKLKLRDYVTCSRTWQSWDSDPHSQIPESLLLSDVLFLSTSAPTPLLLKILESFPVRSSDLPQHIAKTGGLDKTFIFSQFRGWPEVAAAGLASGERSPLGRPTVSCSLCAFRRPFLCAQGKGASSQTGIVILSDQAPYLGPHLTLITSLKALCLNIASLGA